MKKKFLILFAASGILCLFAFTGCVKDNILPSAEDTNTVSRKALNFGGFILPETNTTQYGTLTGIVLPLEAQARVYLIGNTTIELDLDDHNGSINKNEISVGEYSVYIQPENLNYLDYTIDGVLINPNLATDIGTITLQYYGWGGSGCEIGWGKTKPGK